MSLAIYFAGLVVTWVSIIGLVYYMKSVGEAYRVQDINATWTLFMSLFWPVFWALIMVDLLRIAVEWVLNLSKKGD